MEPLDPTTKCAWRARNFRGIWPDGGKPILAAVSLSVINQAVSSGTNFLIGVYLARVLSAFEFGVYGLGFSFILLFAGLCSALFVAQMVVKLPAKDPGVRDAYVAGVLMMLLGFCVLFLGLVCTTGLALSGDSDFAVRSGVVTASALAAVAYVGKDFFVRLAYSKARVGVALAINLAIALVTLGCFATANLLRIELDATSALETYAAAHFVGLVVGACCFTLPFSAIRSLGRQSLAEIWQDGKWSLGGAIVIWLQTQAYVYVTAATLGPAGVGLANAARLFISPFMFLSPAVSQLMLPRLSARRISGVDGVLKGARMYSVGMLALAGAYLVGMGLCFEPVQIAVLGDGYPGVGMVATAWGAVLAFQVIREGASTALQALMEFRSIFLLNVISALVTCMVAAGLAQHQGATGAVAALACGEIILGALLWCKLNAKVADMDKSLSLFSGAR